MGGPGTLVARGEEGGRGWGERGGRGLEGGGLGREQTGARRRGEAGGDARGTWGWRGETMGRKVGSEPPGLEGDRDRWEGEVGVRLKGLRGEEGGVKEPDLPKNKRRVGQAALIAAEWRPDCRDGKKEKSNASSKVNSAF